MTNVSAWMSWEGGFDLVGMTSPALEQPNVIVHVARMVHTPQGSAPSGMILFAPDGMPPRAMGFVSHDEKIGAYFGPHIFAGTPFENAPLLPARIEISNGDRWCEAHVEADGLSIEARMEQLGALEAIHREAGVLPFTQTTLEAIAGRVTLRVNGEAVALHLPPIGLSGGAPAVWAATGLYAR